MVVLLLFAFISGLVTIAAPCIWPLLPIVLSSSSVGGKAKPLGITLGIMTSFTIFTLTISYIVKIIPFDPNILRLFAVVVIGFLGLTLIVPQLNQLVEGWVSRLSGKLNVNKEGNGFGNGFLTGFALGLVWSPCAGPILATIATLAATQSVNIAIILVTIVYVLGIGVPLFFLATIGNKLFSKTKALNQYTGKIQQVFGVIMIVTALAIFTNFDKTLQADLLNAFPNFSGFVNTLESNPAVQQQLNSIKNTTSNIQKSITTMDNLGPAPEFTGITKWLNTDKPLTMADLKGKVVLVDFWTYTCINCIRTLPHVTNWYDKYKDKGFVVIGVHTPEFEFEKKTTNVEDAIKRFNIHYPLAQDNDYATWQAYNNEYWPAEYLIDAKGIIRHTHFGEGEYDLTEQAIQSLLQEAGQKIDTPMADIPDQTPHSRTSPETYVGTNRAERFASNEELTNGRKQYTMQPTIPLHSFALSGTWDEQAQYASSTKDAVLTFHFSAEHVYLVMHPAMNGDKVKMYIDDKPITDVQAGKDVKNGEVHLDVERLYDLVDLHGKNEEHTLKLMFENVGTQCFAFTFG